MLKSSLGSKLDLVDRQVLNHSLFGHQTAVFEPVVGGTVQQNQDILACKVFLLEFPYLEMAYQ
jgi:hypothetical protein